MKWTVLAVAVTLVGCGTVQQSMPRDVELMPTDCVNRVQIVNWLQLQLNTKRSMLQSEQEYEREQSRIKHSLWNLRYRCQPV